MRNFFKFLWPSRNTYLSVTKLPHKLGISLLLKVFLQKILWYSSYSKAPIIRTGPVIRTVLIFLGTLQL